MEGCLTRIQNNIIDNTNAQAAGDLPGAVLVNACLIQTETGNTSNAAR
jgi:hypothetical protein